jgi:hypothetical protein
MRSRSPTCDGDIFRKAFSAKSGEDLFFELALADLTRAAEPFQPVFALADGMEDEENERDEETRVRGHRNCYSGQHRRRGRA